MNDLTKQILALSEETLGKGYFSRETLAEKMERTVNGPVTLVLDGKLVGFAMAYPPGKWSQGPNLSFPSDGMGFLETVLVEPISRNLWIGSHLVWRVAEIMGEHGAEWTIASVPASRKAGSADPRRRFFRGNGFLEMVEHYDSPCELGPGDGRICRGCPGNGDCHSVEMVHSPGRTIRLTTDGSCV